MNRPRPNPWTLAGLACLAASVFLYTLLAVLLYDCAAHDGRPSVTLPEPPGEISEPTLFP